MLVTDIMQIGMLMLYDVIEVADAANTIGDDE